MVDLNYFKKHLRIEDDTEDELLSSYLRASEEIVLRYINQSWSDIVVEGDEIPHSIKNAVCMIAAAMYRDREGTSTFNITKNPILISLLKPFKKIIR